MTRIMKYVLLTFMSASVLYSNGLELKYDGVKVTYTNSSEVEKSVDIKRLHDRSCRKINGAKPDNVWGGDYAKEGLNPNCTKTFLTTAGKIQPMKLVDGVDTLGELEVISFIKDAQANEQMLLVDARMQGWYKISTIPTAVNMPFKSFEPKSGEFENILMELGVEEENGKYDFSDAKSLLLFCNGAWCPQSGWAIENLISIGYPKDKLKWYRAGMYGWTSLNLTTIKP